jgi:hypothetical protein
MTLRDFTAVVGVFETSDPAAEAKLMLMIKTKLEPTQDS